MIILNGMQSGIVIGAATCMMLAVISCRSDRIVALPPMSAARGIRQDIPKRMAKLHRHMNERQVAEALGVGSERVMHASNAFSVSAHYTFDDVPEASLAITSEITSENCEVVFVALRVPWFKECIYVDLSDPIKGAAHFPPENGWITAADYLRLSARGRESDNGTTSDK